MIITVGLSATMGEFLDRGRSGSNASTFLTRLQAGGKVVDGRVVAALLVSAAGDGVLAWVHQGAAAAVELVRAGVQ